MEKPNLLRVIGRSVLKTLSVAVINKHHPTIIVLTGDGNPGILKEAIYTILKKSLPTRRSVEGVETELAVPLTVIGYPTYPATLLEWLAMVAKTTIRLLVTKPYKHTLLIELPNTDEQSFKYWLEVTKPKMVVICGKIEENLLLLIPKEKRTFTKKIDLSDYEKVVPEAIKLAAALGISESKAENDAKGMDLPKSKIRLLKGLNGRVIIDSTYLYSPPPLKSIEEVADALPGKKVILLDNNLLQKEKSQSKYPILTINEKDRLSDFEVIIIRGFYKKFTRLIEEIT